MRYITALVAFFVLVSLRRNGKFFSTGKFNNTHHPLSTGGRSPGEQVAADFNGDGKTDLAVVNFKTSNISMFLGR